MAYLIKILYFLQLAPHALCVSPDPVDVTIDSQNFQHFLRWQPGAGTPVGTQYRVQYKCSECESWSSVTTCMNVSSSGECEVTEEFKVWLSHYRARVQAFNGASQSNWISSADFMPLSDTILGPPEVSVTGCGDCLLLKLKPPIGKGPKPLLDIYHEFDYTITMKNNGEREIPTSKPEFVLENLEPGTEYCVTVRMYRAGLNMNSKPSEPHCAFTSPEPVSKVAFQVVPLCIVLLLCGVLVAALFYSGFLCPLKIPFPKVLASFTSASRACNLQKCLALERCPVDHVTVLSKRGGRVKSSGKMCKDSSDSKETDSGEEDWYEKWIPGQRSCNSEPIDNQVIPVENGQALDPSDPAQALCLVVCGKTAGPPVEQPDLEPLEPLLERRDSVEEESCQDVNLFSVMFGVTDEEILESPSVEMEVEKQPEDSKRLPEKLQQSPLLATLESVACRTDLLNREIKDEKEQRLCSDSEEEDDSEFSGYMKR
ncbi:interferon alpha/beta receptor 2-like isoform X1 [Acipenser oxyrinchus oxyrinchus]|uniref:Interferon alpha/beta receptor 2-like isoform X1 n=1 Tax=Acipenser oxyrinchus oxyrinchus TaxID=40147 RepID=A0AAD8G8Z4_ACIOX|nr:interferon alpha/beta receptor 2-like isoform X1 [Acipenser oxyrinchus oxyrinchus]